MLLQITWAGSQWHKLCAGYGLDPQRATAADVEAAVRERVAVNANRELVNACSAGHDYLRCIPDLSERGRRVLADLDAALGAALKRGD
jgi:hypothetical protein